MRITVFSIGTQGDVRPLVALGVGLKKAGHQVRMACNENFQDLVESAGLEFAVIKADFLELMLQNPDALRNGKKLITKLKATRKGLLDMAEHWPTQGIAAAQDSDLLLGNGMTVPIAASLAEKLNIPFAITHLQPMTPTRKIPPVGLPLPRSKPNELLNLLAHHFVRFAGWQILRPAINLKLRKKIGLKPYPIYSPYFLPNIKKQPIICGYSQHLVPTAEDWKSTVEVAGFWFYDQAMDWVPPEHLTAFLNDGPMPIYIGFGSMMNGYSSELTEKIIEAVRLSGYRAILATGWGGISAEQVSGLEHQICLINNAPHDWLLPKVRLAVHHGGAGTTAAAVRAGIPSVVVPFLADQPFWAWNLKRLNVSPGYLELKKLTAQRLAEYIQRADEKEIKQNASDLGDKIRSEDGVNNALMAMRRYGYID